MLQADQQRLLRILEYCDSIENAIERFCRQQLNEEQ